MPLLIVTANDTKLSQRFLVREQRFAIGRLRSSAVPIRDKSVSKTHVMISRTPSGYFFQDLFSRNGTYLNEERCDSGVLRSGDVLRLGRINITFLIDSELEEQAEAATPIAPKEPDPLSDTQVVPVKPTPDPPEGAIPPVRKLPRANLARTEANLAVQRSTERRIRLLVTVGTGIIGLLIGLLLARMDSIHQPKPERTGAGDLLAAGAKSGESESTTADAPGTSEATPDLESLDLDAEAPSPSEEARIREAGEELQEGLRRPFSSPDESRRVLYRLCLDLLERTPTRAEERELLPLDPAGRWRRIVEMARSGTEGGKAAEPATAADAFRRFLGRRPTPFEERVLRSGNAPKPASGEGDQDQDPGAMALEAGLLLTASDEYRSADYRRTKSPRQKARSLVVDLIDRPPSCDEEALEVERALERFPAGKVARVLAGSPEGGRALPAATEGADGPKDKDLARNETRNEAGEEARKELREWVRAEIQRFLLRSPSEPEIDRVMEEVVKSREGPGRLRIALAGLTEYRTY